MSNLAGKKAEMRSKFTSGSKEYPPIWAPTEDGQEIYGEVIAQRDNPWGGEGSIWDVKDEDGTTYTLPTNVNLVQQIGEKGIAVGKTILIRFDGTQQSKKNRTVKLFSVSIEDKGVQPEISKSETTAKPPPDTTTAAAMDNTALKAALAELAKTATKVEVRDLDFFLNKLKKLDITPDEAIKRAGLHVTEIGGKKFIILG